jgi:hypothetical protein
MEVSMLHWYSKLTVVALVALVVSSAVGTFGAFGFHW